ncbi:hypothetical protein I0P70_20870 [Pontibacter sp. FD36]|uniref:hypothetical protein n=1 Tax=Pontibacter sp. FD36 TaxID=2789860 RepID=UPI0018AA6F93|nr:hypothetical protein [Pontibacter sp. FD36]MBF8965718.1 hypothetical protein [Pontibacter sp. FD36]
MKSAVLIVLIFILSSCNNREVKYSGLNDLSVGVQQVVLYNNGEFYLELSLGGAEGTYEIKSDTVHLSYIDKPENWPDKLLMTDSYFITLNRDNSIEPIRIRR